METLFLRREDFSTATWKRLTQELSAELQRLREMNDADMDPTRTASIRGQIKQVKNLLRRAEEARQQTDSPE